MQGKEKAERKNQIYCKEALPILFCLSLGESLHKSVIYTQPLRTSGCRKSTPWPIWYLFLRLCLSFCDSLKYLVSILPFFFGFSNLIYFKGHSHVCFKYFKEFSLINYTNIHGAKKKEKEKDSRKWWQSTRRTTTVDHDNLIKTIQLSLY